MMEYILCYMWDQAQWAQSNFKSSNLFDKGMYCNTIKLCQYMYMHSSFVSESMVEPGLR